MLSQAEQTVMEGTANIINPIEPSAFTPWPSSSSSTSLASSSSSASLASSSSASSLSPPKSSSWDVFIHRRSRSNSPNNAPFLIDLSYLDLNECDQALDEEIAKRSPLKITEILLNNNLLQSAPVLLSAFVNVQTLDLSSNCLKLLDEDVCRLVRLRVLICKENELSDTSLPKDLSDKSVLQK